MRILSLAVLAITLLLTNATKKTTPKVELFKDPFKQQKTVTKIVNEQVSLDKQVAAQTKKLKKATKPLRVIAKANKKYKKTLQKLNKKLAKAQGTGDSAEELKQQNAIKKLKTDHVAYGKKQAAAMTAATKAKTDINKAIADLNAKIVKVDKKLALEQQSLGANPTDEELVTSLMNGKGLFRSVELVGGSRYNQLKHQVIMNGAAAKNWNSLLKKNVAATKAENTKKLKYTGKRVKADKASIAAVAALNKGVLGDLTTPSYGKTRKANIAAVKAAKKANKAAKAAAKKANKAQKAAAKKANAAAKKAAKGKKYEKVKAKVVKAKVVKAKQVFKVKVDKFKLKTLTAAYIHDYLKATVLQAKSYKQYLKDTKSKSADGKKVEKLIKAMKKLVKKSKTKLNEAVKEEKAAAAAKKGSSTVIIIVVVVVALLVVVGVVVYCRRKKGGDDK